MPPELPVATDTERIEALLSALKGQWLSSPAGIHWHEYYKWLAEQAPRGHGKPPAPLILAASGASDSSKLTRLREQLEWASRAGFLQGAISRLEQVPAQNWNSGTPENWDRDFFP